MKIPRRLSDNKFSDLELAITCGICNSVFMGRDKNSVLGMFNGHPCGLNLPELIEEEAEKKS